MKSRTVCKLTAWSIAIFIQLHIATANKYYYYDFTGPYCATRRGYGGKCCDSRQDECSVPISSEFFDNPLRKFKIEAILSSTCVILVKINQYLKFP